MKLKANLYLYGVSYIGKTTLVDSFENVFFINTDGNHQFLENEFIYLQDKVSKNKSGRISQTILRWKQFLELVDELADNDDIETICIDLIEDLYSACRFYIYDLENISHESDSGYSKGWDLVYTEFIRGLYLLQNTGKNLIFISKAVEKETKKSNGGSYTTYAPDIRDKVANKLSGMVWGTFCLYADEEDDRKINITKKDYMFGGSRLRGELPSEIDLNPKALYDLLMDSKSSSAKKDSVSMSKKTEETYTRKRRNKKNIPEKIEIEIDDEDEEENGTIEIEEKPKRRRRTKKEEVKAEIIDYDEDNEFEEIEEEPKPKRTRRKAKVEDEEENDNEDLKRFTANELMEMLEDIGITPPTKKSKAFYINLLKKHQGDGVFEEDEEEEKPKRKSRRTKKEDDEEPKPKRKRRPKIEIEEDEEEEKPRKRGTKKSKKEDETYEEANSDDIPFLDDLDFETLEEELDDMKPKTLKQLIEHLGLDCPKNADQQEQVELVLDNYILDKENFLSLYSVF